MSDQQSDLANMSDAELAARIQSLQGAGQSSSPDLSHMSDAELAATIQARQQTPSAPQFTQTQPVSYNANVDEYGRPVPGTTPSSVPSLAKYEDYPTFAEFSPSSLDDSFSPIRNAKLTFGYALAGTPEGRARIIKQNIPDATFSTDKYNNPLANVRGQTYHIARPDTFNAQNLSSGVVQGAVAAPLIAAASAVPGGPLIAAGAQGIAGAGGSMLGDVLGNLSGSEERIDPTKAAITGVINAAVPFMKPAGQAFSDWFVGTNGVQSLPTSVRNLFASGVKNIPLQTGADTDLALHAPEFKGFAQELVGKEPYSEASNAIVNAVENHSANAPARIAAGVDQSFGPMTVTERQAADDLLKAKSNLGPQLEHALNNSPPVDPSATVTTLDTMMGKAPNGSPQQRALQAVRRMLVETEGTPGIPTSVDPQTGLPILGTGKPAQTPTYVTDPRKLENIRVTLDKMIKFGDADAGINPGTINPKDYTIGQVRQIFSKDLKDQIPGYSNIMGKYANTYDMLNANEAGANLFSRGQNALRPDQVAAMAVDPETGDAFRVGARAAIHNRLATNPDDIAALNRMTGGAGDYTRQNLEALYGPDAVDNIQSIAGQELNYKKVANDILSTHKNAKSQSGANIYQQSIKPILSTQPIQQAVENFVVNPVNKAADWLMGRTGPAYESGLGQFLTMPRQQAIDGLKNEIARRNYTPAIQRGAAYSASPVAGQYTVTPGNQNTPIVQRATGGRVGDHHERLVSRLMTLAERAKKDVNSTTEPLLNVPDATIVKALHVANQAI